MGRDGIGHRAERSDRRETHHERNDAEEDFLELPHNSERTLYLATQNNGGRAE